MPRNNVKLWSRKKTEACQDDKNVSFLKSKKWVFSKGVNPWFQSKNPKFLLICV